jgi:hypothetical protein
MKPSEMSSADPIQQVSSLVMPAVGIQNQQQHHHGSFLKFMGLE